jgi:putrescine importer
MASASSLNTSSQPQLRRVLRLRDLIFYGIIIIQPTAPMPVFGVVSQAARGHVVTAILVAMVAMMFTAVSYGRMARVYPTAGSAYTYVSREIHPGFGYLTGWSITMDYLLNPLICTIWCAKAAANFPMLSQVPYTVLAVFFAALFTLLNLRGIETSAQINQWMGITLGLVVLVFFVYAVRYVMGHDHSPAALLLPFYDPKTFSLPALSTGSAIAVLTYIGFDSVSTLSEEVENPQRNILLATVLTCLITGVLASLEVYLGQLIWPDFQHYPDVDTAFVHIAMRAGGAFLFGLMNLTLVVATIGSGFSSQLAAARLLYGMGRENALPRKFFGAIEPVRGIPRNNVIFSGVVALAGALVLSYDLGAELLNYGAFIAFMGVNASAFVHDCLRERKWGFGDWAPPILGFVVCFYIWLNLSMPAKKAGTAWLALGIIYGWSRGTLRRNASAVPS